MPVEYLTWKKARNDISKVNQKLTKIIDDLDPPDDHLLIKVVFPYGSEILKQGILHLPDKHGNFISFHDAQFDASLHKLFAYNLGANPVAILLKNTAELFLDLNERIIPFAIIPAGKVFGTWKVLDGKISHSPSPFSWGLTAGARSVFMLQKISEAGGYNRLKSRLDINIDKANKLLDHWRVFKEIAHSQFVKDAWESEIIFFSGHWFEHKEDQAWNGFNYYLTREAWEGSSYWRNQFIWGVIFSTIQEELAQCNVKLSLYTLNLVKQLLLTGTGAVFGFQPAIDNSLAPVRDLQEVFVEIYGLKYYAPIIMQPAVFDLYNSHGRPVYYSLQHSSAMEFAAKSNEKTSTLVDLYYLRRYLHRCINEILKGRFGIDTTPLYKAVHVVQYDFYHNNPGHYKEIQNAQIIFAEDSSFKLAAGNYKDRSFHKNSSFFNGCIRLAYQNY